MVIRDPQAVRRQLLPQNFEQLQQQGDIGNYLMKIRRIYQQGLARSPCDELSVQGAKAEYYLAAELKRELRGMEGYLFNHLPLDIRDHQVSGPGLSSFPDHLLVTRNHFLYIETMNWSKNYLAGQEQKCKTEIAQQVELTQRHLARLLKEKEIKARPEAYIYDHQGTLGGSIERIKVISRIGELVLMIRDSQDSLAEYQKIIDEFGKLAA